MGLLSEKVAAQGRETPGGAGLGGLAVWPGQIWSGLRGIWWWGGGGVPGQIMTTLEGLHRPDMLEAPLWKWLGV